MRADGPPDEYPETGQCVHKFGLHPDRPEVLYQQNHSAPTARDDGGRHWLDVNEGLPSHFGFPLASIRTTRARSGPCRSTATTRAATCPTVAGGLGEPRRGRHLVAPQTGPAPGRRLPGRAARGHGHRPPDPAGVYFGTSTGQLFGSRDEGRSWRLLADFLPGISSVETPCSTAERRPMATVHLPRSLVALLPGVPRRLTGEGATVAR